MFGSIVLFSPVEGKVVLNGAPIEGAEVTAILRDPTGKDRTTTVRTDAEGIFSLPLVQKAKGILDFLPGEYTFGQEIRIEYKGTSHLAWEHFKRDTELNSESGGKTFRLLCRLEQEDIAHGELEGYRGICELQ